MSRSSDQGRGDDRSPTLRDREAVDICVEDRHRRALARQGDREIDGHVDLPHAALARRDRYTRVRDALSAKGFERGVGPFGAAASPPVTMTRAVVTVGPAA